MSQKQLHWWFVHELEQHCQLLDRIPDPLHSPKRKKVQFGYVREVRGPRYWSVTSNSSVLKSFIHRFSHCKASISRGNNRVERSRLVEGVASAGLISSISTSFVQFMVLKEEWSHHLIRRKGATYTQLGAEILPTIRSLDGLSSRCLFSIFPTVTTHLHLNN
jgi:hypothetical protein